MGAKNKINKRIVESVAVATLLFVRLIILILMLEVAIESSEAIASMSKNGS